jgi:hypothetical protein
VQPPLISRASRQYFGVQCFDPPLGEGKKGEGIISDSLPAQRVTYSRKRPIISMNPVGYANGCLQKPPTSLFSLG